MSTKIISPIEPDYYSEDSGKLFAKLLKKEHLILDGPMGTMIQNYDLDEADFRNDNLKNHPCDLKGNNDLLTLTRPDIIEKIHTDFLLAGSNILETNTFSSTSISQADYQLESFVGDLNIEAVKLAKNAIKTVTENEPDRKIFVAGSIGPTNRTASLSPDVNDPGYRAVTFGDLVNAYKEQTEALIDGGVDCLLVETIFDTLNAKAALFAIESIFDERKIKLPIMISVTITDKSGRTLSGQTPTAFWYSVEHTNPISVGINCALGAEEMRPYLQELSNICPCHISIYANAGLPNAFGGYDDTPANMASVYESYAQQKFATIWGGCCGTTPEHIKAIKNAVIKYPIRIPLSNNLQPHFSGLEPLKVDESFNFIMVGERTNITGSPKFARCIKENNFEGALQIARQQVESGANVIDINMDEGLID